MIVPLLVLVQTSTASSSTEDVSDWNIELTLGTRVHTRYQVFDESPSHRFSLRRARLFAILAPADWIEAQVDFEVSDSPSVKDAFADLKLAKWFRVSGGQLKKPFSLIELTGPGKLPLIERGIVNDRIVDTLGFGGRDQGLVIWGKKKPVRWALGGFNGSGTLDEVDSGKDVAARFQWRVVKGLKLGASGSMKYRNPEGVDLQNKAVFAAGGDVAWRFRFLEVAAEALWAQERLLFRRDHFGAILYALASFDLSDDLSIAPIAKFEILDDDLGRPRNLAYAISAGANLHIARFVRLMLQGERVIAESDSELDDRWRGTLQLAFDASIHFGGEKKKK
jgi:hypothetical protein